MNQTLCLTKKNLFLGLCTVLSLCSHVVAFNYADYCSNEGDKVVQTASGDVYVSARQKGRLGCTLSRLPVIKKDESEAAEEALMHKIATINHEKGKENPLFNDSIAFFTMFDSGRGLFPLMVGESSPATLYLMERHAPCTLQGDVIIKEKKEDKKPAQTSEKKDEKKSSSSKTSADDATKDTSVKEEPAPCEILSSGVLKDAAGNDAGEIVAVEAINSSMVAVAVAPQGGVFGAPGSGIALVQITEEPEKKDSIKKVVNQEVKNPAEQEDKKSDVQEGEPKMVRVFKQISVDGFTGKETVRAYPLNNASSVVTFGASPVTFGKRVSLHWDKLLERLFIGLDVTAADDASVQTACVVVARVEYDEEEQLLPVRVIKKNKTAKKSKHENIEEAPQEPKTKIVKHAKLLFEPIIPKVALNENVDYIVAQKGSGNRSAIDSLRVLWTSTQTPHLIVVRRDLHEKGAAAIFALPLVSGKSFELGKQRKAVLSETGRIRRVIGKEGSPERKKQEARNAVITKNIEKRAHEIFLEMQKLDVTCGTLASVQKGVEKLFSDRHPYSLEECRFKSEVQESGDLFASQSAAACVGGGALHGCISALTINGDVVEATVFTLENTKEVYISRPLLNAAGMIESWTAWRSLTAVKNVMSNDTVKRERTYFDGQHDACTVAVEQKDGVVVRKRLKNEDASDEPLHCFASKVNELCKDQTMLGAREVVVAQQGAGNKTLTCAYSTKQLVLSSLDRLQGVAPLMFSFPCDMKSIRGVAVAVGSSNLLFVGGYNGLYVLVDAQGQGLPLDKKVKDFSPADCAQFSFIRVGSVDRIRALMCDEQFLYVLTNKTVERIDVAASSFSTPGEVVSTTLAFCDQLPGHGKLDIFLDLVVSEKLVLLATTRGLFRSGDNLDMRLVNETLPSDWVRIHVPCQEGPIVQLVPLSVTGLPTDCARYGGGELYVLNSYAGYNATRVTRYQIADCSENTAVSDKTVRLLPDHFMKNEETTFMRLNDYTTSLVLEGGSCLLVHPLTGTQPSCLYEKEFSAEKSNAGSTRFMRKPAPLVLAEGETIISAALSAATGKMLVTTSHGLRILD